MKENTRVGWAVGKTGVLIIRSCERASQDDFPGSIGHDLLKPKMHIPLGPEIPFLEISSHGQSEKAYREDIFCSIAHNSKS